jgi:hypothetical protein
MKWVGHFQTQDRRFGYNLEPGGNVRCTQEETRKKQSEVQKRRFAQPGAIEKLSALIKATPPGIPDSTKAALSKAHAGHTRNRGVERGPQTEEHRQKIAASRLGRTFPHRCKIRQIDALGSTVAEYPSLSAAARVVGCAPDTLARCARGVTAMVAGFRWEFVEGVDTSTPHQ